MLAKTLLRLITRLRNDPQQHKSPKMSSMDLTLTSRGWLTRFP